MNWKENKTALELEEALKRQVANMRRSLAAFDEGALEEAERIASAIYIICHDSPTKKRLQQKSLLTQVGLKNSMGFTDTAHGKNADPGIATLGPPLLAIFNDINGIRYVAPGAFPSHRQIAYSRWAEGEVYQNISGKSLTRKNLIFYLRSQDGGAHVDDHRRDEAYYRFVKFGDHVSWNAEKTFSINATSPQIDTTTVHWLTTRQIGAEIDDSLKRVGF